MSDLIFHIYIPHHFFERPSSGYLYGLYSKLENCVLINCTYSLTTGQGDEVRLQKFQADLGFRNNASLNFGSVSGFFNLEDDSTFEKTVVRKQRPESEIVVFMRRDFVTNSINVAKLFFGREIVDPCNIYLLVYSATDLFTSRLIYNDLKILGNSDQNVSFIEFLIKSIDFSLKQSLLDVPDVICAVEYLQPANSFTYFWNGILFMFQWVLFAFKYGFLHISKRCPRFLSGLILKSSVGRQFHQRIVHVDSILKQLEASQPLSLKSWNIIVAIFLDVLVGCYLSYKFSQLLPNSVLLHNVMGLTDELIDGLQCLLSWLMGVPAGLKLNIPLNNVLGHFFLFHIHLWRTYIDTFAPILRALVKVLSWIGVFGLTWIPSFAIDLSSLLTIHIYCFYGYASRLYYYQLTCLSTLWRVFRGKRWNHETQRVESFTYEVHNLYIGTLLFTVLLFLLPTVMVYYFVFAALRIAILLLQGLLSRITKIMTVLPIYTILLRIFQSKQTTGGVYFSVLKDHPNLVLSMEITQLDILAVIQKTIPETEEYNSPVSLKSFALDFFRGKIIYPI